MPAIQALGLGPSITAPGSPCRFAQRVPRRLPPSSPLDLAVRQGEMFGFLGPNGAGKSTTIRLLLGFLHPTAGSGRVLGLDIVRDSVAIRRRVGYLPGGIALYDSLTGEADARVPGAARAVDLRFDGPTCASGWSCRPPRSGAGRDYSRGMRQKMGIVQALQHDPELAILDEPTEGLDPLMQRAFYDILDMLKAEGRTISFPRTSCRKWSACVTGSPSSAGEARGARRSRDAAGQAASETWTCACDGPRPAWTAWPASRNLASRMAV